VVVSLLHIAIYMVCMLLTAHRLSWFMRSRRYASSSGGIRALSSLGPAVDSEIEGLALGEKSAAELLRRSQSRLHASQAHC